MLWSMTAARPDTFARSSVTMVTIGVRSVTYSGCGGGRCGAVCKKEPGVRYRGSVESRERGVTYHLVPTSVWEEQSNSQWYTPEGFDAEGYIHCTNGLDMLLTVGNRYYRNDTRPYTVLILEVQKIECPVRYDDPDEIFPHIYGPLNTNAVVGRIVARRDGSGRFIPYSRE